MRKTLLLMATLAASLSISVAFADESVQIHQAGLETMHIASMHQERLLASAEAVAPAAAAQDLVATNRWRLAVAGKQTCVVAKLLAPLAPSETMAAYTKWGSNRRLIT